MATYTVTFRSKDLGEDVPLMLCFSQDNEGQHPVAWKSTTLSSTGRSYLTIIWSNALALSTAQVGSGQRVVAGNYIPINYGQGSMLQTDETQTPPVYHWSEPRDIGAKDLVQASNRTTRPVDIGLGCITDLDTDYEYMDIVALFSKVPPGSSVNAQFTPLLSAYLNTQYNQGQIITSDIKAAKPIWTGNLNELRADTNIIIKRNDRGEYYADVVQASQVDESEMAISRIMGGFENDGFAEGLPRVFSTTLSFKEKSMISASIVKMAMALLKKGYRVKVVRAEGTEVDVDATLPIQRSFAQAEEDVMDTFLGVVYPPPVATKSRAGHAAYQVTDKWSFFHKVNPASHEWGTPASEDNGVTVYPVDETMQTVTKMLQQVTANGRF